MQRARTISLMWPSFILFLSDLHHWTSPVQPPISRRWRRVSCCMLCGRVLMPLLLYSLSSVRDVRSPNLSCSATIPFLQSFTVRSSREEIHWTKFVEPHVRSLQSVISKYWRQGRWRSKLHWCRGTSQHFTWSKVVAIEEEALTWSLFSHEDSSIWSLLSMITCLPGGEQALNLNKGQWFILNRNSSGNASSFKPSSAFHSSRHSILDISNFRSRGNALLPP